VDNMAHLAGEICNEGCLQRGAIGDSLSKRGLVRVQQEPEVGRIGWVERAILKRHENAEEAGLGGKQRVTGIKKNTGKGVGRAFWVYITKVIMWGGSGNPRRRGGKRPLSQCMHGN